jgi:hypothetical protein
MGQLVYNCNKANKKLEGKLVEQQGATPVCVWTAPGKGSHMASVGWPGVARKVHKQHECFSCAGEHHQQQDANMTAPAVAVAAKDGTIRTVNNG